MTVTGLPNQSSSYEAILTPGAEVESFAGLGVHSTVAP